MESPGGWRLIGSTPLNFYNPVNNPPVLCEAGEYIRFDEDVMVAYTGADMQAKLDEEVIPYISSANVACGFHASDPLVMVQTVRLGVENHTAIGAHPGYPDLVGFGRRNMAVSAKELKAMVQYQVGVLQAFCKANHIKMQHVKPHGAMYNMAAKDEKLACAIAEAVYEVDPDLILLGLSGTLLIDMAKKTGLKTANEVFADRAYQADSICLHGDGKKAVLFAKMLFEELTKEGIEILPLQKVVE